MKALIQPQSIHSNAPLTSSCRVLLLATSLCLAACGKPPAAGSAAGNDTPLEAGGATSSGSAQAAQAVPLAPPAQVSEAAEALDLSRAVMFAGAENPAERSVVSLLYRAPAKPDAAFKFHRDQLVKDGWQEQAGTSVTPEYASGMFAKRGLRVSLSGMPDKPGTTTVALRHHGNVVFEKLPVPASAKVVYAGPTSGIFSTDTPLEATTSQLGDALAKAGWTLCGTAISTQWFKQNAVMLCVLITEPDAQKGKTMLNFTSEMLPVDAPIPPGSSDFDFSKQHNELSLRTTLSLQDCEKFYRDALGKKGWKSTKDASDKIGAEQVVTFQNSAKDILRVAMRPEKEGKLHVSTEHLPRWMIDEMNRKMDAQAAAFKAAKEKANP